MNINQETHGFHPNVNGYYDIGRQLPDYLLRKAESYISQETAQKDEIHDIPAFEARRSALQQKFMEAIGGLPTERTPLNAKITGTIDFENATIQKVVFESLPKMYVTANLYIPKGLDKPTPAVLMTCGHSNNGKAAVAYQQVALDLAANGIIVLLMDPIGQGERFQYDLYDDNGTYMIGSCSREHTYIGQQCILTGSNVARFMIWDMMRAIDYLESLDIVDSSRIGLTGNSGGGTQTSYMMFCEPRLAAAMPCCYISSRLDYMKTGQVQDAEQIVHGIVSSGINHDDLITGMAPRPIRLGVARYDFFCADGAEKTYHKARKIYEMYASDMVKESGISASDLTDDLVSIVYAEATHSYSTALRQGAVNFFRRVLLGLEESFVAVPNRPVLTDEELFVTSTGRILSEFKDAKTPWQYLQEDLNAKIYTDTDSRSVLKDRILKLLKLPNDITSRDEIRFPRVNRDQTEVWCDVSSNNADSSKYPVRIRKLFFFSEEDILCTGVLFERSENPSRHCTIYVSNNSTMELEQNHADIEKLLEQGAVLVFDPRGIGAAASRPVYLDESATGMGITFNNYYKLNSDAQQMGTSLYAMRVYDILRAYDLMTGYFAFENITLAGRDYGAVDILTAAALSEDSAEPVRTIVFGTTISFEELVRTEYYRIDPRNNIYGILQYYDVPLLKKVLGTTEITD